MKSWQEVDPEEYLDLREHPEIDAPLNEAGERCPWPWEPERLAGAPLGQYHCTYCGAMVVAGMPHLDYKEAGE